MKSSRALIFTVFLLLLVNTISAQLHISGIVKDDITGERLIGANILEAGTTNGISTDNNGYFSLVTKKGNIKISFIGYKSTTLQFSSDTMVHISLEPGEQIDEVTVRGEQSKRFNISTLNKKEMLSIPSIGGKPDVLKALQMLPGIQSQQEGTSLLNVRGGNPGENLYLFDNTPIIYVNHLGGFMSVFNPDMINNIEVYKGGFPAKYGGKLSSIVSIAQREGDKSKLKGSLGIGVTDVSFCIEGPLLNKKASFIVTGRKTLTEPLYLLACNLTESDYNIIYGFHDLNGKFSWHPDDKNSLYFNFYQGDDYIKTWNRDYKSTKEKYSFSNTWGNWLLSARWNKVISPRLFVDNTFSYTRYRLNIANSYLLKSTDTVDYKIGYQSTVQDFSIRSDWQFSPVRNLTFDFGAVSSFLAHIPNKTNFPDKTSNTDFERILANETSIYANGRFTVFKYIDANIGARLVNYHSDNFNKTVIEPRIMVNAKLTPSQTVNFTFQHMNQFAHLVFTSGSIMNNEIWIPADKNINPSGSVQYSAGWKGSFLKDNIQIEANIYYKELNNLATYKEGYSNLMGDGNWRSKIETGGSGLAKGVELLIRKTTGKWTGFLGYTYSKSTRKYPNINRGEEYLFEYDRPHSVSININRQISEKWDFTLSWVYQTGLPYTPVIGRQIAIGRTTRIFYNEEFLYGERNSARMKDYHRMDVGFTYTTINKRGRKEIWNFSVYNLYNRHNPSSYYYGYDKDGFVRYDPENYTPIKQYQISFFPIIPSVSYKVFFDSSTTKRTKEKKSIKQKLINYLNYESN